jgi:hypothetical protein
LRVDFKIYQRVFAILVKSPNAAQAAVDMLLNIEKAAIITTKAILKVCLELGNIFLCITPSLPPSHFLSLSPSLSPCLHPSIHPSLNFIHWSLPAFHPSNTYPSFPLDFKASILHPIYT